MTNPFAPHLDAVIEAALDAGRAVMAIYAAAETDGSVADRKQDGSPVTAADHAAEAILLATLTRVAPDIPALSEEQVAAGRIPDVSAGTYWCVDPLDGTKEFVNRTGEFTLCVGGVFAGYPVFGVLHAPALGLTFAAAGPGTAVRIDADGTRTPIAARVAPSPLVALTSRSHRDGQELDEYIAQHGPAEKQAMGSAAKFGLIAAAQADLYVRFGPTSEWDTAAGQAVLEAAGGSVLTLDGQRLSYGKPRFLNPGFIARGRAAA